ncbi:MAG TPA: hypothetical protein VM580_03810 [Labilithrix sp.]|nr:hypothetical protein [Labilithrix sp.]
MRSSLLPLVALVGSGLAACAVPAPEPGPETASSTATAIVMVERTSGPGDAIRGDAVIARFIRVRQGAVDDPALRIAGVAEDIPAPGTCSAPADPAVTQGRSVELLDVGPVALTSAADGSPKNTVLLPRSMPDPAGVVSGVFYSARTADVFAPGSRVSLRADGGADLVDGFSVAVTAPHDVGDVRVASTSTGLDVSWDADDTLHDLVYVDVLSPAPRVVVRCTSADTGHLFVPQNSIPGIEEGQLAVHRLHKESFKAKGIDPGEVRFDVAKVVTFRR